MKEHHVSALRRFVLCCLLRLTSVSFFNILFINFMVILKIILTNLNLDGFFIFERHSMCV